MEMTRDHSRTLTTKTKGSAVMCELQVGSESRGVHRVQDPANLDPAVHSADVARLDGRPEEVEEGVAAEGARPGVKIVVANVEEIRVTTESC